MPAPKRTESSDAAEPHWDADVWHFKPFPTKPLDPPPLQAKPNLKTLQAELHLQAQHCHDKLQKDLDSLHQQVLSEVHAAVSQELLGAAHKIASVQSEAQAEILGLRTTVQQLCDEAQRVRTWREQDAASLAEVKELAGEKASQLLASEASKLRDEATQLEKLMREQLEEVSQKVQEHTSLKAQELQKQVEAIEASLADTSKADAEAEMASKVAAEMQNKLQVEAEERSRLAKEARAAEASAQEAKEQLSQLQEALHSQAAVSEARFRDSQQAFADLASRSTRDLDNIETRLVARAESIEAMISGKKTTDDFMQSRLMDMEKSVQEQFGKTSQDVFRVEHTVREELAFAHAAWARLIDWEAEVDVERVERDGKLDVSSPIFMAAGLRNLQLHLRFQAQVSRQSGDRRRWAVGAFLQAPAGQVSFKLHVGGKSMSFAAEFGQTPEWGSQRLVVLDSLEEILNVRLEILDVVVPINHASIYPPTLTVSARSSDAAQAAAREANSFRSSMVRRIEWRVTRVSERMAAARAAVNSIGNDEALEPIVSPPFAAGGFEGLQLHLYPLGYRPKGEEMCGFFLQCPKGMYVKCRAFVGDAVRNWDHVYEEREPYGRGSFCRLLDKADDHDSVVCGVELQEIRMEHTTQVRAGPFGNVQDQLKVISNPSVGSMEHVRELKELNQGPRAKDVKPSQARSRRAGVQSHHGHSSHLAEDRSGAASMSGLANSKSLPLLLPHVVGPGTSHVLESVAHLPLSPSRLAESHWR